MGGPQTADRSSLSHHARTTSRAIRRHPMPMPDRRLVLTAAVAGLAAAACSATGKKATLAAPAPAAAAAAAVPTTRTVPAPNALEKNLLVGCCGAPGSPALGRMTGDLTAAVGKLQRQIHEFPRLRPI